MFKFKDLYVSVSDATTVGHGCEVGWAPGGTGNQLGTTAACGTLTLLTPTLTFTWNTPVWGNVPVGGGGFGSLKDYLKAALETEEAREKAMAQSQQPQTVAEVEMLEEKLNGALEELRARKAALQKKKVK